MFHQKKDEWAVYKALGVTPIGSTNDPMLARAFYESCDLNLWLDYRGMGRAHILEFEEAIRGKVHVTYELCIDDRAKKWQKTMIELEHCRRDFRKGWKFAVANAK